MTLPLQRVVVHPDGALVHRAGRLAAESGRLMVGGLPLLLDPSSVRLGVTGALVGDVQVELDVAGDDRGPEPALVAELREASDAWARTGATLEGLRHERAALRRLLPSFDGKDADRKLPEAERLARWAAVDEQLDRELEALDRRVRALARELVEGEERLRILRARVASSSSAEAWRSWWPTHRVRARVDADGELDVELSYRVPGARWTPSYVLDADAGLQRGRFSLRALVAQDTGEDWTATRLTLTTAPVARRVDVPELPALRLGARSAPSPAAFRPLPAGLDGLFPELGHLVATVAAAPEPEPEPEPETSLDELLSEADHHDLALEQGEGAPEAPAYDLPRGAPVAPPMMKPPPSASRSMSAPMPMRKSSGLAGAVGGMFGGGGPPPGAPARQRAADTSRRAEAEAELVVGADLLDYGRLRLASFDAPAGKRGRLAPAADDTLLAEASVPEVARSTWRSRRAAAASSADRVATQALPPRHSIPGPIEGTDVRIDADGTVDVPSDGGFHSVAVRTWTASLAVSYRAVPRHDPRAFRRVEATIDHAGALLPGPVDVYVDGRLELTAPWAGTPGRGRLLLGLGAEDRVRVVRNVRYREESAGIFGNSRRLHTTIEVKVESSLQRPVKVELLERLPVPVAGSPLSVEQTEANPVAREYAGEPGGPILKGGRAQVVELAPGGEARAVLSYAVTLGAKDELEGGDRRG